MIFEVDKKRSPLLAATREKTGHSVRRDKSALCSLGACTGVLLCFENSKERRDIYGAMALT